MNEAEPILVRRAARGDRGAFSALIEAHWTPLVRLARSVVGDAEAEDVVQEALLIAWKKLGSLRDPAAFAPWLTRAVWRRAVRQTRRFWPWVPLDEAPEPASAPGTEAGVDVEKILAGLAPRQRAVMHLTVVEGMSDREIGDILELDPASVRSHRRRARQRLDQLLNGARP